MNNIIKFHKKRTLPRVRWRAPQHTLKSVLVNVVSYYLSLYKSRRESVEAYYNLHTNTLKHPQYLPPA